MNLLVKFVKESTGSYAGLLRSPTSEADAQTISLEAVRTYLVELSPARRRIFIDCLTMVFCTKCGGRRVIAMTPRSEWECNCDRLPESPDQSAVALAALDLAWDRYQDTHDNWLKLAQINPALATDAFNLVGITNANLADALTAWMKVRRPEAAHHEPVTRET